MRHFLPSLLGLFSIDFSFWLYNSAKLPFLQDGIIHKIAIFKLCTKEKNAITVFFPLTCQNTCDILKMIGGLIRPLILVFD